MNEKAMRGPVGDGRGAPIPAEVLAREDPAVADALAREIKANWSSGLNRDRHPESSVLKHAGIRVERIDPDALGAAVRITETIETRGEVL